MKLKGVIIGVVCGILLFIGVVKILVATNFSQWQDLGWKQVVIYLGEKEITEKEVDIWEKQTQWICEDGVYFLEYKKEDMQVNLYYKENGKKEKILLEKGIESFLLNEDATKIFCAKTSINPNAFGFETEYGIMVIDLKEKTSQMLIDFDDEYIVPTSLNGEVLYYVELSFDTRRSKVFCLDWKTNRKECIYRTGKKVVGVINAINE